METLDWSDIRRIAFDTGSYLSFGNNYVADEVAQETCLKLAKFPPEKITAGIIQHRARQSFVSLWRKWTKRGKKREVSLDSATDVSSNPWHDIHIRLEIDSLLGTLTDSERELILRWTNDHGVKGEHPPQGHMSPVRDRVHEAERKRVGRIRKKLRSKVNPTIVELVSTSLKQEGWPEVGTVFGWARCLKGCRKLHARARVETSKLGLTVITYYRPCEPNDPVWKELE